MSKDKERPKEEFSKVNIDSKAVRELADLLKETDLSEIEYESGECRIRVVRQGFFTSMPQTVHAPSVSSSPVATDMKPPMSPESHPGVVKSPMVGTAYFSPKPGDPPFISVGSTVSEGQTLMIIEAMKVMNPLKSSKSGKVTHILIEDGQPIEFDEALLVIE